MSSRIALSQRDILNQRLQAALCLPIGGLDLSVRTTNALEEHGIT